VDKRLGVCVVAVIRSADTEAIAAAVDCLRAHEPVVMPTETVYGLAGATFDPIALKRVFELKGRPADNPLIAHVGSVEEAEALVDGWDDRAKALAAAFWPGSLTLILPRCDDVPAIAAGGRDTLAVRMPEHSVAQALLKAFGGPLSAPSANRSGRVSPTAAVHVQSDYADLEDATELLILDGGPCAVGVESTVLSLADGAARLLRPGSVRLQQLEGVIGPIKDCVPWAQGNSPGSSPRHYAPQTPVELVEADAWVSSMGSVDVVRLVLPVDPDVAQAALYTMLRDADNAGAEALQVKMPPDDPRWRAVRDRLLRAAHRSD
jgi:L-threonylcarbamoyladenylate synthase